MKFSPVHFQNWIDDHRDELKPPVCNKQIWKEGEFIVMVVGGPNVRKDFHIEEGPELFYQIEGEMNLRIVEDGKMKDIPLKAGEMFLLPSKIPHSPQRFTNSIGLVVERIRRPEEQDGFMWFCDKCETKIHEEYFHLVNVETQLAPIFERFFSSKENRTCPKCSYVMPIPNKEVPEKKDEC